jgi:2-dehydropantoate 2-reductase
VIVGAGAIGGVVGARLAQRGEEVVLIARGEHLDALRRSGLRLESPEGATNVDVRVAGHPRDAGSVAGDVLLLAVKSHQTAAALETLTDVPCEVPIVSLQNGVDNERTAARYFRNVYGACVMCPTAHLEPGVVEAYSVPTTGILDIGRYPSGSDSTAERIAAALSEATFSSEVRPDIMRWKYSKLLTNLGNAVEAICGPKARSGQVADAVRAEGERCLGAAGIAYASADEDAARRGDLLKVQPIGDRPRRGGSTWQSLHRRTGSIETPFLNGEILMLGRLHGVPTPANAVVSRLVTQMARRGDPPGSVLEEELERQVARAV